MEQTEGILIRSQPWSDTSLITTWLTSGHGKIRLMARGARRPGSPLAGKLDLFYKAEIAFASSRRSSLHSLREARLLEPFQAPPASAFQNLFLCGYFAELIDMATEPGQPAAEIYDLLSRAVSHLNTSPASLRALEHFERQLVLLLGITEESTSALSALGQYCGRIPASREAAFRLLPQA